MKYRNLSFFSHNLVRKGNDLKYECYFLKSFDEIVRFLTIARINNKPYA